MIKNRYAVLFFVTMTGIILLNAVICYINAGQRDYVYYRHADMYSSIFVNDNVVEYAVGQLSGCEPEDYPKKRAELQREYTKMSEYLEALARLAEEDKPYGTHYSMTRDEAKKIIGKSVMSESEVRARQEQLVYCMERLNYASDYYEYISGIKNNISEMSGISIFGGKTYKNIIRAENDFYGLENIRISAEPDIGVNMLFSDSVTDIFGIVAAVLCGLLFTLRCRTAMRSSTGILLYSAVFLLGIAALYTANIFITDKFIALGSPGRSVQSVEAYRSCPYMLSVGTVIAVRILFKTAACFIVYFVSTAVFSSKKKWRSALILLLIAAAEALLYFSDSRISFSSLFRAEDIIGVYGNILMFGEAVNSAAVLSLFCAAAFAVSVFAAVKTVNGMFLKAREESEKRYYDEINDKYNETRLIRHDMKNHLTAVAILMDDGRIDEARKYLSDISVEMDKARLPLQTGTAVLDALLLQKFESMRNKGIEIETEFYASFADTGVSEYDLCSIFGNILDNASEASCKLPAGERRVKLAVKRQMDMMCVYCVNNYSEVNDDLSTTKSDKAMHGLGLSRLRRIAGKYSGSVDITAENGVFTLSLILNLKHKHEKTS